MDSGAAITLISRKVVSSLGYQHKDFQYWKDTVTGIDGNVLPTMGSIVLKTTIASNTFYIRYIIVNEMSQSIVIGNDCLSSVGIILDYLHNSISINGRSIKFSINGVDGTKVLLANKIEIPPRSEVITRGTLGDGTSKGYGILSASPLFQKKYDVFVANSIVDSDYKYIPIRLCNPSNRTITLWKNTCVATIECLDSVNAVDVFPFTNTAFSKSKSWNRDDFYSKLNINKEALNESQYNLLRELLWKHRNLFAVDKDDLGRIRNTQHKIILQDNVKPISRSPYRTSPMEKEAIKKEVDRLLASNRIQPSNSSWSAPVIMVKKKDGSLRMCVDYRKLNSVTVRDVYPLPNIDDILESLNGSIFFSGLDELSGYWQVEMDVNSKDKTAFITPAGLFEWNVMPFGLTNAPATFQRAMDLILAGLKWNICHVYLDDIIIFSSTFEDHLERLKMVFTALERSGVKLSLSKCHFCNTELSVLGHVVSKYGISMDPNKVRAITQYPTPTDVTSLRRFLGLTNYYRRYIKDYSLIAAPLLELLKQNTPFSWSIYAQRSFERLKNCLATAPILGYPNFRLPFQLTCDASDIGISAILSQNIDNREVVISYASRTLNNAERNYSTTERECLAVIWGVEHYRHYLMGSKFTIFTDHIALQWLKNTKTSSKRLLRWSLKLAEYNYEVVYRAGKSIPHVDALSRSHTVNFNDTASENSFLNKIKEAQKRDRSLDNLRMKAIPEKDVKLHDNGSAIVLVDDILYRYWKPSNKKRRQTIYTQLIIPKAYRYDVLWNYHDSKLAGHLGIDKTIDRVRSHCYWPGMIKDIEFWISHCETCARSKGKPSGNIGPLQSIPTPKEPWEMVGVDVIGPFKPSSSQNRYIVIFTDYLSRWAEAFAVKNHDASTISKLFVENIICRFGTPDKLLSDCGAEFLSEMVAGVCDILSVNKLNTSPYHPQTNGLTEKTNRTLVDILRTCVDENQKNWDSLLPYVLYAYRSAVHTTTKETPFYLTYGRDAKTPTDILFGLLPKSKENVNTLPVDDYRRVLVERLETAHSLAKNNIELQQLRSNRLNQDRSIVEYNVGDRVYVYIPQVKKSNTKKLTLRWHGPYKITSKIGPVTYHVVSEGAQKDIHRAVHVSRMKPYLNPVERELYYDDSIDELLWDEAIHPISTTNNSTPSIDVHPDNSSNQIQQQTSTSTVYDPYTDIDRLMDKRITKSKRKKSQTEYLVRYKDGVQKWVPRTHVLRKQIMEYNSRTS